MAITSTEAANIHKLVAGMFNLAADAAIYTDLVSSYEVTGNSLSVLASNLAQSGVYISLTNGLDNAGKAAFLLANLGMTTGTTAGDAALDYFNARLTAGISLDQIAVEAVTYLNDDTRRNAAFDTVKEALDNKATVAQHFVDSGIVATTRADLNVIATVTANDTTVTAAQTAIDTIVTTAAIDVAAQAQYALDITTETAGTAAYIALELAAAQAAEAAIAAGATTAQITAAVAVITADNAATVTLANIVALDAANTAVTDYLDAVDAAYDTNADGSVTALEITGELLAAANAYNAISNATDLSTTGAQTAAEIAAIHTAALADLNVTLTTDNALLAVQQALVDAVSGLEAAITLADTKAAAYEAAYTADAATQLAEDMYLAAYNAAPTVNVAIAADGSISDLAVVTVTTGGTGNDEESTVTFNAMVAGQSVTIDGVTLTATAAMTAVQASVAFEAAYTAATSTKLYTVTDANTADANLLFAAIVQDTNVTDITHSINGTDTTNPGITGLKAAITANLAAAAALTAADTALTAAVQSVVDTEQGTATVMDTDIIDITAGVVTLDYTGADLMTTDSAPKAAAFIAAQGVVIDAQQDITDLAAAKVAYDAINAVDDALTPLEATAAAAATALVGEDNLANGANVDVVGQSVYFLTDLVATDAAAIDAFELGTDYLYVGTDYTYNTGALTTGNNSALEFFMVETAGNTVITFETEVFGSASTSDFFTVTLTGVAVADVTVENGMIIGA